MEDFVPYELAVKLKEKGFKTENTDWCYLDGNLVQVKKYINISPYKYAPTISQALKWLREEKRLHICISYDDICAYSYDIVDITDCEFKVVEIDYNTYEQAALAGIEYVLDNLI